MWRIRKKDKYKAYCPFLCPAWPFPAKLTLFNFILLLNCQSQKYRDPKRHKYEKRTVYFHISKQV